MAGNLLSRINEFNSNIMPRTGIYKVNGRGSPCFGRAGFSVSSSNTSMGDVFVVQKSNEKPPQHEVNPYMEKIETPAILFATGVIPMIRRNQSVFKKIKEDNKEGAAVQVGVSLMNLPSDLTQMVYAGREYKAAKAAGGYRNLAKRLYQKKMPFVRNTKLEFLTQKYKWLENADKTLFDTGFGDKIRDICKIKFNENNDMMEIKGAFSKSKAIEAVKTEGNILQRTVSNSLLRISVLGIATTALLEAPAVIKSVTKTEGTAFDKLKALSKQLIKSGAYVGLITTGIAVGGAVLFPYGILAELIGMAIGSTIAMTASNKVNKKVDNIFKN